MNVLIFFCLALPSAALSAVQWLWRYTFHRETMNGQDRGRVDYWFGITSPAPTLQQAWTDLRGGRPGDKAWSYELRKNLVAEWAKLDAHRAAFFLAAVAVAWFGIAALLALALVAVTAVIIFAT